MLNEIQKAIVTTAITMEMGDIYKNGTQIRKKSTKEVMDNENFVRSIMTTNSIDSVNYDEVFGIFRDAITERYNKQKSNAIQLGETKKEKHGFNTADLEAIENEPTFPYMFNSERMAWECKPTNGITMPCVEPTEEMVANDIVTFYADNPSDVMASTERVLGIMATRLQKLMNEETARMLEATKFDPSCVEYLDESLKTIHAYFQIKEPLNVFKATMKHWMKNCKVTAFTNNNREDHLWLNFFGAQGAGKTTFVKRFKEPFKNVSVSVSNFASLIDTWHNGLVFRNVIVACDECGAKDENSDKFGTSIGGESVKIMKSILTEAEITQTKMKTQVQRKITNRANFISTANVHIYDSFDDPTGMRRFFEYTCECGEKNTSDFVIMDSLDIYKMWRGVDETCDYLTRDSDEFKIMRQIQATYIKVPLTVRDWLVDATEVGTWRQVFQHKYKTWQEEFALYEMWCKDKRKTAVTKTNLQKVVERRGVKSLLEFAVVNDDTIKDVWNFIKQYHRVEACDRMESVQNLYDVAILLHNLYKRDHGYKAMKETIKETFYA